MPPFFGYSRTNSVGVASNPLGGRGLNRFIETFTESWAIYSTLCHTEFEALTVGSSLAACLISAHILNYRFHRTQFRLFWFLVESYQLHCNKTSVAPRPAKQKKTDIINPKCYSKTKSSSKNQISEASIEPRSLDRQSVGTACWRRLRDNGAVFICCLHMYFVGDAVFGEPRTTSFSYM